jgi:acyl-CoA reductase-like NAD-dependent aldehyde dehydrogenase
MAQQQEAIRARWAAKGAFPLYLAGEPILPGAGTPAVGALEVRDKFTGDVAATAGLASPEHIDAAFRAAESALPAMRALKSFERKSILRQVVSALVARQEEFAECLAIEAGKPLRDARGEIQRAIDTFEIASEEAVRVHGTYEPLDISERARAYTSVVRKFPIGVVSMIAPFNFPWNLVAHKVAPALAAGCPFVLKPASATPLSGLLLGEVLSTIEELPRAAWSILPCSRDGADLFTTHEVPRLLSFTGSPDVGWALKARAGKKPVVLELGGNAACIVDEGTDIDDATARIIHGGFYQSGQSCISVQRVIVHESLIGPLTESLVAAAKKLPEGDPLVEDTFIGPMISEREAMRIESWIREAESSGATVNVGGVRRGNSVQATILSSVPRDASVVTKEAFAPVIVLSVFSDFKEAVAEANESDFGLQAGVFTNSIDRVFYAFENIEAGGVVFNDVPSVRVDSQPYGGVKDSGLGREGITHAMEDMLEKRVLVMRNVGDASRV